MFTVFSPRSDEMNRSVSFSEKEQDPIVPFNSEEPFDLVFSFAGGGTGGIGSLEILRLIDDTLQIKSKGKLNLLDILNRDDVIVAGTSTGSIITALLKLNDRKNPNTGIDYRIVDFQNLYGVISPKLFTPNLRWLACCCLAPFSKEPLVNAAHRYIGKQKVRDSPGLVIMAFNKTENFSEMITPDSFQKDYLVGDAAEASSSIPCAFAPKIINKNAYSDGGTCVTNLHPTVPALRYYKYVTNHASDVTNHASDVTNHNSEKINKKQVVIVDIGAGISILDRKGECINPNNKGGLCCTLLDGTICDCASHLTNSGPEIAEKMLRDEPFGSNVFSFDFKHAYPLAFTNYCLMSNMKSAYDDNVNNPRINELVSLLIKNFDSY